MEIHKAPDGFAIELPMDSWYGSRRFRHLYSQREFLFPRSWNLEVFAPQGIAEVSPLSADDIRRQLQRPTDTEPLRKLAETCRDAVIIVDDLSRPTPAFAVLPLALDELDKAGIGADRIRIVIGVGTHRPITLTEQRRKLGHEIPDRVEVINHNCFTRRLKTYRRPDGGPDFQINRLVGDADLKISISGVIPHGGAGFGGGAKAILPSVASYETIRYNHSTFAWEGYGIVYPEVIRSPGIRRDMELVARAVGLDYSINLVSNPNKEVMGVFAGDFVKAHRRACHFARELYLTDAPLETLDVVLANSYPMDTDIGQSYRGTWPEKFGRQSVLVAGARDGWAYHGDGGKSYQSYRRSQRQAPPETYAFKQEDQVAQGRYYAPKLSSDVFYARKTERRLYNEWHDVIASLDGTGRQVTVGIFPYASLQLENTETLP